LWALETDTNLLTLVLLLWGELRFFRHLCFLLYLLVLDLALLLRFGLGGLVFG